MARAVKVRRYDGSARRAAARARQDRVLGVASRLMLRNGYHATTIGAVAEGAGVSDETVYKAFGGKPGLVRALFAQAVRGSGPVSAETRSDELRVTDAPTLIAGWARLATEVAPRAIPVLLLVRDAARSDAGMRLEYDAMDSQRHDRMHENARSLAALGGLRVGITAEEAGDVLFTVSSPEMYELLVLRQGWSVERYGRYVRDTLTHALMP